MARSYTISTATRLKGDPARTRARGCGRMPELGSDSHSGRVRKTRVKPTTLAKAATLEDIKKLSRSAAKPKARKRRTR